MEILNLVKYSPHLRFYITEVKSFIEQAKKNKGQCPSWQEIDKKFPHAFGKRGARKWFYDLMRRYSVEFKDDFEKKKNSNYNPKIASKLRERFDEIDYISKTSHRACQFTNEETEQIIELL